MVKSKSLRKKRGGNKGGQKRADKFPNIQINIDGGGFFDELKNAFGLNPISENTEKVIDPEKSKRFSENLQKAMEAGIEEKRAKNELKSEEMIAKNEMISKEMIAKNEMKSKEKDQNFMKDMMDKMNQSNLEQSRIHKEERENLKKLSNNNVNSAIVKTINEKIPLVLNELQQLRVYVDSIDQNIKKNRESQIQEKIEEKKEEEEIVNLRQKLMDRDKMILNIFNSKKNELLNSL